jgi:hypothetical protein
MAKDAGEALEGPPQPANTKELARVKTLSATLLEIFKVECFEVIFVIPF